MRGKKTTIKSFGWIQVSSIKVSYTLVRALQNFSLRFRSINIMYIYLLQWTKFSLYLSPCKPFGVRVEPPTYAQCTPQMMALNILMADLMALQFGLHHTKHLFWICRVRCSLSVQAKLFFIAWAIKWAFLQNWLVEFQFRLDLVHHKHKLHLMEYRLRFRSSVRPSTSLMDFQSVVRHVQYPLQMFFLYSFFFFVRWFDKVYFFKKTQSQRRFACIDRSSLQRERTEKVGK